MKNFSREISVKLAQNQLRESRVNKDLWSVAKNCYVQHFVQEGRSIYHVYYIYFRYRFQLYPFAIHISFSNLKPLYFFGQLFM